MIALSRVAAVALALIASAYPGDSRTTPWTRGPTPPLAGTDVGGRKLDLRDLRGRVVLVEFWASWCEPCQRELPVVARLRAEQRARGRPFEVVAVDFGEGPERIEQFLRERGVREVPVLLDRDGTLARAWGVGGIPMSFLVAADGRVDSSIFGECDWTKGEPAALLERLVREAEARSAPGGRGPREASASPHRGGDRRSDL